MPSSSVVLLDAAIATGAGEAKELGFSDSVFQAKGATTAGSGSATITIQVSTVRTATDTDWITAGTITLTLGTSITSDGFTMQAKWPYVRAYVTAISGTGAYVNVRTGK